MHPSYYRRPLFLALLFFALFIGLAKRTPNHTAGDISLFTPQKQAIIEAVVAEYPREREERVSAVASVRSLNGLPAHGRILVQLPDGAQARWGALVRMKGELAQPFGTAVPGNLDWKEYLAGRGVFAQLKAESLAEIKPPPLPLRVAGAVKNYLLATYRALFSRDIAAILSGLTLGDKSGLTQQLSQPFMDCGTVHLLVASGTKVGFVAALAYMFCALIRVRRRVPSGLLVLCATGFYLLVEGCDPPLVRSYVMGISALLGYLSQRESGAFQGLVIAAFLILGFDNQALFKADFQLSFAATFAIVLVFSQFSLPRKWPRWLRACVECAIMTVAAQIALFPVSVPLFHRYSPSGFIANIPMIPLSGVLLALSFSCAALSALKLALLLKPLAALTGALTLLFWKLGIFFASFSWSVVTLPELGGGTLAASACAAFVILHLPTPRLAAKIFLPALAVALLALVIQWHYRPPGKIWAFREGKSACLMFHTSQGKVLLVDAGINGDKLYNAVVHSGTLRVDAVFLSSLEETSWKGLSALAQKAKPGAVYIPYGPLPRALETVLTQLKNNGVTVARLWYGDKATGTDWSARAVRGLHQTTGNRYWTETGYSGMAQEDSLSFDIETGPLLARTGSHAAFARLTSHGQAAQFDIISRRAMPATASFTEGEIVIPTI